MTSRVETHIRLGIRSVSPSDPPCPHGETLGPYLPIAKVRRVSPRNFTECLRKLSGVSQRNLAEETLGEISDFYFSPRKKFFAQWGFAA